jgi:hypothetical protein
MRTVAAAVEELRRPDGVLPPLESIQDLARLSGRKFLPTRDAWNGELFFRVDSGGACIVSLGLGGRLDGVERIEEWCLVDDHESTRAYEDDLVLRHGRFTRGPTGQ